MAFTQTYQVPKEFFNLFLKQTTKKPIDGDNRLHYMLPVELHNGATEDFMVRYFKRSGESSAEDLMEYYPSIIIQDFQPEVDRSKIWGKDYIEGVFDVINGTVDKVILPVPLMYRFQVSAVTRRLKEIQSIGNWFLREFNMQGAGFFEFNKVQTPSGFVADVTPYRVDSSEVPREDGRFEYTYTFEIDTYVHVHHKKITWDSETGYSGGNFQDAVTGLNIALNTQDYRKLAKVLEDNISPEFSDFSSVVEGITDPKFSSFVRW